MRKTLTCSLQPLLALAVRWLQPAVGALERRTAVGTSPHVGSHAAPAHDCSEAAHSHIMAVPRALENAEAGMALEAAKLLTLTCRPRYSEVPTATAAVDATSSV
jgi:hypothetical protein